MFLFVLTNFYSFINLFYGICVGVRLFNFFVISQTGIVSKKTKPQPLAIVLFVGHSFSAHTGKWLGDYCICDGPNIA